MDGMIVFWMLGSWDAIRFGGGGLEPRDVAAVSSKVDLFLAV